MKIISKHKDYYDSAIGLGIDETLVYIRNTVEIKEPQFLIEEEIPPHNSSCVANSFLELHNSRWNDFTKESPAIRYILVGFCGKTYVCAHIFWQEPKKDRYSYGMDDFNEYVYGREILTHSILHRYLEKTNGIVKMRNLLDKYHDNYQLDKLFRFYKAPVFAFSVDKKANWRHSRKSIALYGQVNPSLKGLEFYKTMDPYTAFQEISMYLGGVLGSEEKSIIEISDEDKAKSRGFHGMSFRKREHQSKPRRNKKK